MSAPPRSPVLGYNHNIRHRGIVFHVQTEDSGVENPHLYTHVFQGGTILTSRKLDYDGEAAEETVKALMQAQHRAVLKDLKRGAFDEKIDSYFGHLVDDGEAEPGAADAASETLAPDLGRAATEIDAGDVAAGAELSAGLEAAAAAVPAAVADNAEEDETERMEVADDVAAAFDAVQDESTSPAAEVQVTWRSVSPPPGTQPPPIPSGGARPDRGRRDSGAPRVPHPDDSHRGVYRHRRPSRDVIQSPLAEAAAREASAQQAAEQAGGDRPSSAGAEPSSSSGSAGGRSPVVVSRPSVIVGGPSRGRAPAAPATSATSEAKPAREAETRQRQRPPKRRREGLFGQDLISEKSLDEVILAYLSEDTSDE